MKATETLHEQGQSLWLDNISRDLLQNGTLATTPRSGIAALEPEDVVLGGGNVHKLDTLPPGCSHPLS